MMVIPYKPEHLLSIELQEAQEFMYDYITPEYATGLARASDAYTTINDNGDILFCGGLAEYWNGRAMMWSFLSRHLNPRLFVKLHKKVLKYLAMQDYHRIEVSIAEEHAEGIKWAELLGFERESLMKKYTPDAQNSFMYVRLK